MTPQRYENLDELRRLIPVHARYLVKAGKDTPHYRFNRPDFDRVPVETFLVQTTTGTAGRHMEAILLVVKPNEPANYPPVKLTDGKRLLYRFWALGDAVRMLGEPRTAIFRHVVMPGDPRHAMVMAFKIACDHVHASRGRSAFPPDLLYRALGVEPLPCAKDWT